MLVRLTYQDIYIYCKRKTTYTLGGIVDDDKNLILESRVVMTKFSFLFLLSHFISFHHCTSLFGAKTHVPFGAQHSTAQHSTDPKKKISNVKKRKAKKIFLFPVSFISGKRFYFYFLFDSFGIKRKSHLKIHSFFFLSLLLLIL